MPSPFSRPPGRTPSPPHVDEESGIRSAEELGLSDTGSLPRADRLATIDDDLDLELDLGQDLESGRATPVYPFHAPPVAYRDPGRTIPERVTQPAPPSSRGGRTARELPTEPAPSSANARQIAAQTNLAASPAPSFARQDLPTEPPPPPSSRAVVPRSDRVALETKLKAAFQTGDYELALEVATRILQHDPQHLVAASYADSCRELLELRGVARIKDSHAVVTLAISPDQLRWLQLDHRAGFVLSLVDGRTTLEEMIDISGMPREELLAIVGDLLDKRIVQLL